MGRQRSTTRVLLPTTQDLTLSIQMLPMCPRPATTLALYLARMDKHAMDLAKQNIVLVQQVLAKSINPKLTAVVELTVSAIYTLLAIPVAWIIVHATVVPARWTSPIVKQTTGCLTTCTQSSISAAASIGTKIHVQRPYHRENIAMVVALKHVPVNWEPAKMPLC